MRDKCIGQELSWERPAVKWEAVLEELFFGAAAPAPSPPRPSPAEAKASVTTPVQVSTGSDAVKPKGNLHTQGSVECEPWQASAPLIQGGCSLPE